MSYKPINCSFHDLLLDRASRKVNCELAYEENGLRNKYNGKILDVYSYSGEEYLIGENNFKIRLDRIISLDDTKAF